MKGGTMVRLPIYLLVMIMICINSKLCNILFYIQSALIISTTFYLELSVSRHIFVGPVEGRDNDTGYSRIQYPNKNFKNMYIQKLIEVKVIISQGMHRNRLPVWETSSDMYQGVFMWSILYFRKLNLNVNHNIFSS